MNRLERWRARWSHRLRAYARGAEQAWRACAIMRRAMARIRLRRRTRYGTRPANGGGAERLPTGYRHDDIRVQRCDAIIATPHRFARPPQSAWHANAPKPRPPMVRPVTRIVRSQARGMSTYQEIEGSGSVRRNGRSRASAWGIAHRAWRECRAQRRIGHEAPSLPCWRTGRWRAAREDLCRHAAQRQPRLAGQPLHANGAKFRRTDFAYDAAMRSAAADGEHAGRRLSRRSSARTQQALASIATSSTGRGARS